MVGRVAGESEIICLSLHSIREDQTDRFFCEPDENNHLQSPTSVNIVST